MNVALTQTEFSEPRRRSGWTLPALLVGLGVIAVCLIVPQVEENRGVLYDLRRLQAEEARVQEQIRSNEQFLARVAVDPTLISRLAQRQLRLIPGGTETLELSGAQGDMRSPFQLSMVAPVATPEPYKPFGGEILGAFRDQRTRLYMLGAALFVMAAALILDGPVKGETKGEPAVVLAPEPQPVPSPVVEMKPEVGGSTGTVQAGEVVTASAA